MKRMTWFRGAAVVALMTGVSWAAFAADHLDGAGMMHPTPSEADITDVYSWVDSANMIFVLDVAPLATNASKFSDKVQYVFHTESSAGFGSAGKKTDIICTFKTDQTISCWVGDQEYVTGDASKVAGLKSASGKVTVFAGLRDDPFYFNLDGFKAAVSAVDAAEMMNPPPFSFDPAGCPLLDAATSGALVKALSTDPLSNPPGGKARDFFAGKNVLSIVLTVDKKIVTTGGPYVSVWASTNQGS